MPSAYTSEIGKGISFKEFIFTCARAFGALIDLRDEPLGSNLPDKIEPSSYHHNKLKELKLELIKYNKMTLKEAKILFDKEKEQKEVQLKNYIKEQKLLKKKYESMLKEVHKWIPPTSEHKGLKKFMIEQITGSIDFDCKIYSNIYKMESKNPKEWLHNKIQNILEDQVYHENNHKEEVERTNGRIKWIQALKKSVE